MSLVQSKILQSCSSSVSEVYIEAGYVDYSLAGLDIPTSEPTSGPNISFTVVSSAMPVVNGATSYFIVPMIQLMGRNQTGSATYINYRWWINGTSGTTGASAQITNNYYFRIELPDWMGISTMGNSTVSVGDTIGLGLWASNGTSGCSLDYYDCVQSADRLRVGNGTAIYVANTALANATVPAEVISLGYSNTVSNNNYAFCPASQSMLQTIFVSGLKGAYAATLCSVYKYLYTDSPYNIFLYIGMNATTQTSTNATKSSVQWKGNPTVTLLAHPIIPRFARFE